MLERRLEQWAGGDGAWLRVSNLMPRSLAPLPPSRRTNRAALTSDCLLDSALAGAAWQERCLEIRRAPPTSFGRSSASDVVGEPTLAAVLVVSRTASNARARPWPTRALCAL